MSLFLSFLKQHKVRLIVVSTLIIILLILYLVLSNKQSKVSDTDFVPTNTSALNISYNNGKKNLPIYSVELPTDTQRLAISFDASWGDSYTYEILDILDKYNIKTTFFVTGTWVDSFPDAVREVRLRGHDLGNHSKSHKQMSKMSPKEQGDEINYVNEKIKELTDYDCFLFRAPFGDYNDALIDTVYGCNLYPIQWNVDSLDWKDYGRDNIIKTVTQSKTLGNGSIILFHNNGKFTAKALEEVINSLTDKGYSIVPISELIYKDNYHMNEIGRQIAD